MLGEQQYAQLIKPLLKQAGGYARSIVRDRHHAEDAVQQAALRGLERLRTYDESRPFRGWWFSILHNCCIDVLRASKDAKRVTLEDRDLPAAAAPDSSDWERLVAGMEQLSVEHREVIRLKYFADLSYRDLAEALSIPQGTVMSRLHLARKALAAKVREEE
jgi:RNA polymerase sigma-70 factor (ECF subfamily)